MTKRSFGLLLAAAMLLSPAFADAEPGEAADAELGSPEQIIEIAEPEAAERSADIETPSETKKPAETAAPQESTSPTTTPTNNPNTGNDIMSSAVRLTIDNGNVYEGMERAYKDGYVPTVENGVLTVILPLVADGTVRDNTITVTPQLGDTASSPIQVKNYQKSFELSENKVNMKEDGSYDLATSYLVRFDFPLVSGRQNGTYSLVLETEVVGGDGTKNQQSFTCYYTITDGQSADGGNIVDTVSYGAGGVTETTPESKPRVIVSRCALDASPVPAGETFTATVILENTSETQNVQNMLVTVSCDSSNFVLQNPSNSIYVGDISAGATAEIEISYTTDLETPPQRYVVTLAMEYDDSDAVTMTSQGAILVEVMQTPRIELSPFQLDEAVNAGETFQMSFQVMNLGRSDLYNVRVEIDVPGLNPVGTAFIGDLAAGTSGTAAVNVFAGMVSPDADANRYGMTSGVVRLIYEDSGGTEYSEETDVHTTINELVISAPDTAAEEQEQARASQWWIAVVIGLALIGGSSAITLHRKSRR